MMLRDKLIILVNSHRRSGTHFLIDALRKNISKSYFPNSASIPVDFNIGSLYAYSDKISNSFIKLINQNPHPVIIKSHLLVEETDLKNPTNNHQRLIKEIFDKSAKLYVHRDGRDVLTSLYHFIYPKQEVSFSSFIREPNDHIAKKVRDPLIFDQNRVKYWSYHVNSWRSHPDVLSLSYSDLKNNINNCFSTVFDFLGLQPKEAYQKPKFPRNKLIHGVQKKLNNYGLASLPESSSVRPRKGIVGDYSNFFDANDIDFYESNATIEVK